MTPARRITSTPRGPLLGLLLALGLACATEPEGTTGPGESSSDTGAMTGSSTGAASECELLAQATVEVFGKYCSKCHGPGGSGQASIDYITDLEHIIESAKVHPGDPESSRIYVRISADVNPMPPLSQTSRPTPADILTVHDWILDCAGMPAGE